MKVVKCVNMKIHKALFKLSKGSPYKKNLINFIIRNLLKMSTACLLIAMIGFTTGKINRQLNRLNITSKKLSADSEVAFFKNEFIITNN